MSVKLSTRSVKQQCKGVNDMGSWTVLMILTCLLILATRLESPTLALIVFVLVVLYGLLGGGDKKR